MEKRIIANDENIKYVVHSEIKRLGNEADLNHIDVSQVTDMRFIFYESKFNGDISNWDVGNVESMRGMFRKSKFNGDISNWDVGNVESMYSMFEKSKFNQDISKWDVSNVVDMSWMFQGSQFNQDISKWDVSKVDDMYHMFNNSHFNKNIDMWNYNFKSAEERPNRFKLYTKGGDTLIEKYIKALISEKFDLADRIKYKMNVIRIKYHVEGIKENKHLVTLDSKLLKEFKEYLWKRR